MAKHQNMPHWKFEGCKLEQKAESRELHHFYVSPEAAWPQDKEHVMLLVHWAYSMHHKLQRSWTISDPLAVLQGYSRDTWFLFSHSFLLLLKMCKNHVAKEENHNTQLPPMPSQDQRDPKDRSLWRLQNNMVAPHDGKKHTKPRQLCFSCPRGGRVRSSSKAEWKTEWSARPSKWQSTRIQPQKLWFFEEI